MITRLRGSCRRREATSSRHALSTLFRRARLRGKPPEVQVIASALTSGARVRTLQVDCAEPPRPSETRTVMVAEEPGAMPVLSKVTDAPVPTMRPAVVLHSYVSVSPSASEAFARTRTLSPGEITERSISQLTVGLVLGAGGGGGGGGTNVSISRQPKPGCQPIEMWRPVQLLELELSPRSSKLRFHEIAGRMKKPLIQNTGPTTRSRGLVCFTGLSLSPVYLVPMSSAWSCTVRQAGTFRPSAHRKASWMLRPSGSPFLTKPMEPWRSSFSSMFLERIRSAPNELLPVPSPFVSLAVGNFTKPRTARPTGSPM